MEPDPAQSPYEAPRSALVQGDNSESNAALAQLKWKSTWLLVLLTIVTYGIYAAHYAQRQSRILNAQLGLPSGKTDVLVPCC